MNEENQNQPTTTGANVLVEKVGVPLIWLLLGGVAGYALARSNKK